MHEPRPYLDAIAKNVFPNFDKMTIAAQADCAQKVKDVIHSVEVGARRKDDYTEEEVMIASAITSYPLETWQADWEKRVAKTAAVATAITPSGPTEKKKTETPAAKSDKK